MRMANEKKKQQKQKKNKEPKVKDLTKGAQAELSDQELGGVSGGMIVSCGKGHQTCAHLIITQGARPLTIRA
jgi:hypothetical protein